MRDDPAESVWLASRFPGRDAETTIARARRRRLVIVTSLAVAAVAAGVVVGVVHGHDVRASPRHRSEPAPWREVLGFLLLIAGVAIELVGLVRLSRSGSLRDNWRSPLLALPFRERRRIVAQVRGRRPTPPEDVPVARGTARRLVNQAKAWPIFLGLAMVTLGQLVMARNVVLAVVFGLVLGLFVVVIPLILRDVRAGRRFLTEHPVE